MNTPAPEPTSAGTSLVGQVVSGRYRIQKLIGEGGMGAVYLAEHTHMRKRVALKLLHAETSQDEEVLARFRREAETAAHVEHPNVAAATDFGQTEDGTFFLVLEYVEGTSLRETLRKGALPPERALHIARQIASALERAHGAGIVHRDLKPENVMLVHKGDDADFVKVLDFGIAKVEPHAQRDGSQPLTKFGTILGTPEYMAPEQAMGETVGPAADLYAVGVMLYEMLTGRHPFDADDRMAVLSMHIVAPVPPMADRNPMIDVPPRAEEVVRQLLEKDAKLRPPHARALVSAIEVAAAQSGLELPRMTSHRSFGRESVPDLAAVTHATASQTQGAASRPTTTDATGSEAPSPSRGWNDGDALAKTDYGLPATPVTPSTAPFSLPRVVSSALERWTASLAPLKRLPRRVWLIVSILVPTLVLTVTMALILTSRPAAKDEGGAKRGAGADSTARSTKAPAATVRAAADRGVDALEALAKEFPEDPDVLAHLARALSDAGRAADMLKVVDALAKLGKEHVNEALIAAVTLAAQAAETTDDAFALLEGPLGEPGIDALVTLSTTKSIPASVQKRATKSLGREDIRAQASAATLVMLDLRAAKGCAEKRELLARVKQDGDARILPALKSLKSARGCGFMGMRDCWSCLRKGTALDDAIKAVEARPTM